MKIFINIIEVPIIIIINGNVPTQLKQAIVTPIFTNKSIINNINNCTIYQLPIRAQILEKVVHFQLNNHLDTSQLNEYIYIVSYTLVHSIYIIIENFCITCY